MLRIVAVLALSVGAAKGLAVEKGCPARQDMMVCIPSVMTAGPWLGPPSTHGRRRLSPTKPNPKSRHVQRVHARQRQAAGLDHNEPPDTWGHRVVKCSRGPTASTVSELHIMHVGSFDVNLGTHLKLCSFLTLDSDA